MQKSKARATMEENLDPTSEREIEADAVFNDVFWWKERG
jgi:hypothetical protein